MSGDPEQRLRERGLELPEVPEPAAAYVPHSRADALVFTAGQLPVVDGQLPTTGTLGGEVSTDRGRELARAAALNLLAVARAANDGSLAGVRVVKLTVFVASEPQFTDQHLVADGASTLLADVLGEAGVHARSAVAAPSLPLGSPVEVEAVLRVA